MLTYPRMRPWFEAVVEDDRGVVLLSETARIELAGPLPAALTPLLTGRLSSDQIAESLAGSFDPALVFFHLIKLEKLGVLEEARAVPISPAEALLAQLGGDLARLTRPTRLYLAVLGGLDPRPAQERLARQEVFQASPVDWRTEGGGSDRLWLVLTPDYLEPELSEFNRRALAQGWRWLPCKPWGVEPCFGPLFTPGRSACLECLLHRMRGHRFEETKALRQTGRNLRLARGHSPASLDAIWGLLGLELQKALSGAPGAALVQNVISLRLRDLGLERHLLTRRPQCPACGDPAAWGSLPKEPPTLRSRPKSPHRDGGERIEAAHATLARLWPRVSPITGEIGRLEEVEQPTRVGIGHVVASTWAVLGGDRCHPAAGAGGDWRQGRAHPRGISAGKGRTRSQAQASALGEAMERYSCQFCGYEPVVSARWAEVAERAIHPARLSLFSPAQYRDRQHWRSLGYTCQVPEPFNEDAVIDWSPAWSLTENRWKLTMAAHVYYHYPPERGGRFANSDSNGVAAGNCLEEACLQALYELIERDAVALWWYNRLRRPALDLDSLTDRHCREVREQLSHLGYGLEVLDLTSDLETPVLAVVALHGHDSQRPPLLGFGCHFDHQIALHRALGELAQAQVAAETLTPMDLAHRLLGTPLGQAEFLRACSDQPPRRAEELVNRASEDFLTDIGLLVTLLAKQGLETLMVDLTRPETGLNVIRVMVPGLVHFWPRLGAERLYRVPVEQGWLPRALREEELNPLPFYF